MLYHCRTYIPPLSVSGGLDTPDWLIPRVKFSTVEQTVNALTRLLFEQEAELARWNAGRDAFVLSFFGGKHAPRPPVEFVADVVGRIEEWLDRRGLFPRDESGRRVWRVL